MYNAPGNGQCERYNGIIWTAVRLALKYRNLDTRQWELVLPDTLHSIRSLLCTATNQTPHERLFNYQRKSSFGTSVRNCLDGQGPVFLKLHVRTSKYDPVVDQVKLVHATPNYKVVRIPSSERETTVSLCDIAPSNSSDEPPFIRNDDIAPTLMRIMPPAIIVPDNIECENSHVSNDSVGLEDATQSENNASSPNLKGPRRSSRMIKAIDRY